MTQPVWDADATRRDVAEGPADHLAGGDLHVAPEMMADTIRLRRLGEGSTWVWSSLISMAEPCECPMKMIGRPWLSWAR